MKKQNHVTIRNGALFCLHCGNSEAINVPISIDAMSAKFTAFKKAHAKCEVKIWHEPEADMSLSETERVDFWLNSCERGVSSNTIVSVCYRRRAMQGFSFGHPLDADDFRRCHLLLKAVPEARQRMYLLESVSPEWKALVGEWDTLTSLFEAKDKEFHTLLENILANAQNQKGTT